MTATKRRPRLPEIVSIYELTQEAGKKKQWINVLMGKAEAPPSTDLGMTRIWDRADALEWVNGNHRDAPEEGWRPAPSDWVSLNQLAARTGKHRMGVYRSLDRWDYGKPWYWCPACHTAGIVTMAGECPATGGEHDWKLQAPLAYVQLECGKAYHGIDAHVRWVTAVRPRGRRPKAERVRADAWRVA